MNGFADRLRVIMTEKNVTQYRLSKISGISQSTLSDILTGKKSPNGITLKKICESLGISLAEFDKNNLANPELDYLFEEEKLKTVLAQRNNLKLTAEQEKAADILETMPKAEQLRRMAEAEKLLSKLESLPEKSRKAVEAIIDALQKSKE